LNEIVCLCLVVQFDAVGAQGFGLLEHAERQRARGAGGRVIGVVGVGFWVSEQLVPVLFFENGKAAGLEGWGCENC
jgi:hypothetical protein